MEDYRIGVHCGGLQDGGTLWRATGWGYTVHGVL